VFISSDPTAVFKGVATLPSKYYYSEAYNTSLDHFARQWGDEFEMWWYFSQHLLRYANKRMYIVDYRKSRTECVISVL